MSKPWLIGIGGTNASGKDSLAAHLAKTYNYMEISGADILREITMEREGNILRPTMYKIGNDLRAEFGSDILCKKALEKYESEKADEEGLILCSVRTKGELEFIKSKGGIIIFTDADARTRYNRVKSRKRDDDYITFEEFLMQQQVEWHQSDNPAEFSIRSVKEAADILLQNENTQKAFFAEAEKVLSRV